MVNFINWWGPPTEGVIQDTWFDDFFKRCCEDYEDADNSKINIYSVFSPVNNLYLTKKDEFNIFFTGENTYNIGNKLFNDENSISEHVDLVLSFFTITKKSIRFPLWLIYWRFDINGLFKPNDHFKNDKAIVVCSHSANGIRQNTVDMMNNINISVCCNRFDVLRNVNTVNVKPNPQGKLETIKEYKYNICCENSLQKGYTTEKIFEAFYGGCIPIYYGDNPVEEKILYQDNIIYIDNINEDIKYKNFDRCKVWKEDALIYIYSTYLKIWSICCKKMGWKKIKENIECIIYECENLEQTVDKMKEHWILYKHFFSPRAKFLVKNEDKITELFMEDISDEIYKKYYL